jgi:hypothetical protein
MPFAIVSTVVQSVTLCVCVRMQVQASIAFQQDLVIPRYVGGWLFSAAALDVPHCTDRPASPLQVHARM